VVVVCELQGNEAAAVQVVMHMAHCDMNLDHQQVFIAVTTPLAWAATPPPALDLGSIDGGNNEALAPETAAAASPLVAAGCYTELDAPSRQPAACAAACHRAEYAIVRAARPGRLATHVVLPGVLYGAGEDDAHLHTLFKAAWQGTTLVQVGSGSNHIPTLHVRAAAAYLTALAAASADALHVSAQVAAAKGPIARRALQQTLRSTTTTNAVAATAQSQQLRSTLLSAEGRLQQASPSYLVVADEAPVSQAQLISAISTTFGARMVASIERVGSEQALIGLMWDDEGGDGSGGPSSSSSSSDAASGDPEVHHHLIQSNNGGPTAAVMPPDLLQLLSIDLPLRTTQLSSVGGLVPLNPAPRSPGGFLDALESVTTEMLSARNLTPLRLLVRGPPASGKSHLAARLARLYNLPLIAASIILAEAPHCDAELQKSLANDMNGKEGRASARTMARLLQHLLARDPRAVRRGFVLDGWPRSLAQARVAFSPIAVGSAAAGQATSAVGGQQQRRQSVAGGESGGTKEKKKLAAAGGAGAKEAGSSAARRVSIVGAHAGGGGVDGEVTAGADTSAASRDLIPHWVVQLDAPREELLRRVKVIAAEDDAASAQAAAQLLSSANQQVNSKLGAVGQHQQQRKRSAGAGKDSTGTGGGLDAAEGLHTHNNERDFVRRYDAWRALVAEDAADLATRVRTV